jgi:cyclopropane fatty-acyl-phospholipid synthase-like methyltransferase
VQKDAGEIHTLVELGTGYCDFINQFPANQKIGYDIRPEIAQFAGPEVDLRIQNAVGLPGIPNNSVDLVFASNFMEHLTQEELDTLLPRISEILTQRGMLILLQPNYRLCPDHYFDDETHQTIFSDKNIFPFGSGLVKHS